MSKKLEKLKQFRILLLLIILSCRNQESDRLVEENKRLKLEIDSIKGVLAEINSVRNPDGLYTNTTDGVYLTFEFKGKKSVLIKDGVFGITFASSYEMDEDIVRIRTDKSDLLLYVKDDNTLVGEGMASGTYVK